VARLGAGAFETIGGEVVNVALVVGSKNKPEPTSRFWSADVSQAKPAESKAKELRSTAGVAVVQSSQIKNPDYRITGEHSSGGGRLLESYTISPQGIKTGDDAKWRRCFWEFCPVPLGWRFYQSPVERDMPFGGREHVIDWRTGGTGMVRPRLGNEAVGKRGVGVSAVGQLVASIYTGEHYDSGVATIVPIKSEHLPAVWAFCSSPEFKRAVRQIDKKVAVTNMTLVKVPFDLTFWQREANERFPSGLPRPQSSDPTQWLFDGSPKGSEHPLQVAVARLLGYRWPRQTGSSFSDCSSIGADGIEKHSDTDGIVCLSPTKGEQPAAARLRALLADAFGSEWSPGKQAELLGQVGYGDKSLEEWLRDGFFEQHCDLFHQRPFIWQVWDGLRDGFHALVNYHRLAEADGVGRRTLEKLVFTYLGDWIDRQRADQKAGVEGADVRVASATHLRSQLEKILEGEPPFDIFARWKALHEQPIGWEPDINDGIRINIRPFINAKPLAAKAKNACILKGTPNGIEWHKDRGKEPHRLREEYPWFWSCEEGPTDFSGDKEFDGNRWNDLHYSRKFKQAARERPAQMESTGKRP
jgi:hypothetical protein